VSTAPPTAARSRQGRPDRSSSARPAAARASAIETGPGIFSAGLPGEELSTIFPFPPAGAAVPVTASGELPSRSGAEPVLGHPRRDLGPRVHLPAPGPVVLGHGESPRQPLDEVAKGKQLQLPAQMGNPARVEQQRRPSARRRVRDAATAETPSSVRRPPAWPTSQAPCPNGGYVRAVLKSTLAPSATANGDLPACLRAGRRSETVVCLIRSWVAGAQIGLICGAGGRSGGCFRSA
jgi:hypothetical protein